jgi:hypothetical protein
MSPPLPTAPQSRSEAVANMTDPEAMVIIELAATRTKANEGQTDPYLVCFEEPFDADK